MEGWERPWGAVKFFFLNGLALDGRAKTVPWKSYTYTTIFGGKSDKP